MPSLTKWTPSMGFLACSHGLFSALNPLPISFNLLLTCTKHNVNLLIFCSIHPPNLLNFNFMYSKWPSKPFFSLKYGKIEGGIFFFLSQWNELQFFFKEVHQGQKKEFRTESYGPFLLKYLWVLRLKAQGSKKIDSKILNIFALVLWSYQNNRLCFNKI